MTDKVYHYVVEFDIKSSSKEEATYNIESWKRILESGDIPMQTIGYRIREAAPPSIPDYSVIETESGWYVVVGGELRGKHFAKNVFPFDSRKEARQAASWWKDEDRT